jgi:hypothetical protein
MHGARSASLAQTDEAEDLYNICESGGNANLHNVVCDGDMILVTLSLCVMEIIEGPTSNEGRRFYWFINMDVKIGKCNNTGSCRIEYYLLKDQASTGI